MSTGFSCTSCQAPTTVVRDSRPRPEGGIRRRRRCESCGARFTTFEVRVEDMGAILAGVEDMDPTTIAQAVELVNILGRFEPADRILMLGFARRMMHPLAEARPIPRRQLEALARLEAAE